MRLAFANTLFTRLFGLAAGAIVLSHVVGFALFYMLYHDELKAHPRKPDAGLFIGIGLEFIALAWVAWLGAKIIARPIQQLSTAATELGDDVDRPPLPEAGPVEARQAARAFNRMQSDLREQIAARGRFLAAVSHDLRTPLTRIRLRVERLGESETTRKLRADVDEMAVMLDATLNYLRGEATAESPALLDVFALVASMVDDYQEQGYAITVNGAAGAIHARPLALRRALANLMENALRYGKQASVDCRDRPDGVSITIADQGPGIPAAALAAVMQPFYRIESSRNKNSGGVGLGLSIAREAIDRQGGSLRLENGVDGGLVATVLLPRGAGAR